jgi:hypothetical protein
MTATTFNANPDNIQDPPALDPTKRGLNGLFDIS